MWATPAWCCQCTLVGGQRGWFSQQSVRASKRTVPCSVLGDQLANGHAKPRGFTPSLSRFVRLQVLRRNPCLCLQTALPLALQARPRAQRCSRRSTSRRESARSRMIAQRTLSRQWDIVSRASASPSWWVQCHGQLQCMSCRKQGAEGHGRLGLRQPMHEAMHSSCQELVSG